MTNEELVRAALEKVGGKSNVLTATNCMTRLRVRVKDDAKIDDEGLKAIEGVMGIVHDRTGYVEIVVGPGKCRKCADICRDMGIPADAAASTAKPVEASKAAAVEAPKAEAADFVKVENVFVAEDFASRDEALSFVSNQAVKAGIASDADAVMNAFLAREAEGTTGMMEGFAIPHAKSDAITEAAVIVVKDESGVTGWDTMDGAPVNVAIALLIPGAQAGTTHLKILSKVAEALMDEDFRATVKGSTDAAEIAKTINARLV